MGQPRKYKILTTIPERVRDHNGIEVRQFLPASTSHASLVPGAGVTAVLAILENCGGKRHFWPAEKLVVNQFREWSPIEDLQIVHAAFMTQKELLLQRIRCLDPMFVEPISAARSMKNEALGVPREAGTISSFVKEPPGSGHYSGIKEESNAADNTSYLDLLEVNLKSEVNIDMSLDESISITAEQMLLRNEGLMEGDIDEVFLSVDDGVNIEEGGGDLERGDLGSRQNEEEEDEGDESEEGDGERDLGPQSEGEDEESKEDADHADDEESNGIYPGEDEGKHSEDADQDLEEACSEGDQDNNDDIEDDSEEGQSRMDIDVAEASPSVVDDTQDTEEMFLRGGPTLDDEGDNDALSEGSSMGPDVDMGSLDLPSHSHSEGFPYLPN